MSIRVGIGGWTFEPWRGVFYPSDLTQKRELEYASRKVTSIEINGTYYGSQKPESFARWRAETPDDFVFSVKGPRFTTNRRVLAEAGESIDRFFKSGVLELKEKLGPINWQFATTKKFDPEDFEAFLKLLPQEAEGRAIRHLVELRHESFKVPEAIALMRRYGVAIVLTDSDEYPNIHDATAPFVYLRLMQASEKARVGYTPTALGQWAKRAQEWAKGGAPSDLDLVAPQDGKAPKTRDVFVYFINGYKPKAPAAAMAMIELLNAAG